MPGKSKPNILTEIAKLKKELNAYYKNSKIPLYIKLLSKFDLPSLKDVDKTIGALIHLRTFPRDAERNFVWPSAKDLIRLEEKRIKERIERQKENERREQKKKQESKGNKL